VWIGPDEVFTGACKKAFGTAEVVGLQVKQVFVVDSHTGGEPTRVIISGGPDLGAGTVKQRLDRFRSDHDAFRRALVNEPRGSNVLVGALLIEPTDPSCDFGVIFFDNVTFIGMCGHGTIGMVETLSHLGRITAGKYRIETPVGVVAVELAEDGLISLENVPSFRKAKNVKLQIPSEGEVVGDVAWGGNWFFLTESHGHEIALDRVEELTNYAWQVRLASNSQGFPEIDHIVLLQPEVSHPSDYRNFVLCPGKAYDRSPCGTGTSARLACLAADGRLAEYESMKLTGIVGSSFVGSYRWQDREKGVVLPTIRGRAFITGENTLLLDPRDPFCYGIVDLNHA
jgi:4-hydroxyproline epimerase